MNELKLNEQTLSQIPALQLLINLGYSYLTPEEALKERMGKKSAVILENILRTKLREINRISTRGEELFFNEGNIQTAIQKLKNVKYDGLLATNEEVFNNMLSCGVALEQNIGGNLRSYNLNYIDWKNPLNNDFHVTAEFSVERNRSNETARPDIVLFVNGIPFCVIECKTPETEIKKAVSQIISYQGDEYIPHLFVYVQMVLGINKNEGLYATVGTGEKFWAQWKEDGIDNQLNGLVNTSLDQKIKDKLFQFPFENAEQHFNRMAIQGERAITQQDRMIYCLLRPERMLELAYKFIVFDKGVKKIARYQQYFVVQSILNKVKIFDPEGIRRGGIVWHTQGSGKSLTMVMLTRTLTLDKDIINPRVVLVTDRIDLDRQLKNTFKACGLEPVQATSGRSLLKYVHDLKSGIITTLIHKFEKAMNTNKVKDDSSEIFVLVDESHRTNYGPLAAEMRRMFPKACYIGFTGTPIMKKDKNSFARFGGLIDPCYSISQAVKDNAVVPLLYEGRMVDIVQNKKAIDLWFERHTCDLSMEQKADLKKKYARAEVLNKTEQVIYMRAFDISEHFRENWKGTGFKAQLVAPGKESAIRYHEYLKELGFVSSEVIISGPSVHEGNEEVNEGSKNAVVQFWNRMMKRYGTESEYNKQIVNEFLYGSEPEILIVVDKLLTGFDAPPNTVLYLCRPLKEHTLLQAIARVNRLHPGKEFGYIIDYASVLEALDQALTQYDALSGFSQHEIDGTLNSISREIEKLPSHHSELLDIFKTIKNNYDAEAYEIFLAEESVRRRFYEKLSQFSKTLGIALSSAQFISQTDPKKIERYKNDMKTFQKLRATVRRRYFETVDYGDYGPKIEKLLNTHIQANDVVRLNRQPVNIFDEQSFAKVKEEQEIYGTSNRAIADSMAHKTKKMIQVKMGEDPALYETFSEMLQKVIDDYKNKKINDLEYLNRVKDIQEKVTLKKRNDVPEILQGNDEASAYYGAIKKVLTEKKMDLDLVEKYSSETGLFVFRVFQENYKVDFWKDEMAVNHVIDKIDDFLHDEIKSGGNIDLSMEDMDRIIDNTLQIARIRYETQVFK